MPSEKVLKQKQELVTNLSEDLKSAVCGVLIDYKGISVADDTALRKEFREAGVKYTVIKNTMLRFATKEAGLEGLDDIFAGTTALAYSTEDPVAPAKIATKYSDKLAKAKIFTIKGGFMDGNALPADKVVELGKLPSKEQLLAQLLSVLTGNIRGLAVALNKIAEQQGGDTQESA